LNIKEFDRAQLSTPMQVDEEKTKQQNLSRAIDRQMSALF